MLSLQVTIAVFHVGRLSKFRTTSSLLNVWNLTYKAGNMFNAELLKSIYMSEWLIHRNLRYSILLNDTSREKMPFVFKVRKSTCCFRAGFSCCLKCHRAGRSSFTYAILSLAVDFKRSLTSCLISRPKSFKISANSSKNSLNQRRNLFFYNGMHILLEK